MEINMEIQNNFKNRFIELPTNFEKGHIGYTQKENNMVKKSVIINDQHIPFEDKKANELVFEFIKDFTP